MLTGTVVSEIRPGKGCWFIEQDYTRDCIFVHQRSVVRKKFLHLKDRVQFNIGPNPFRPGETMAIDVEIIGVTVRAETAVKHE